MKNALIFLLIMAGLYCSLSSCKNKISRLPDDSELTHMLNDRLTYVIMQDGFTPPVASRIYAYSNIAAYQSVILGDPKYKSLNGQLRGLDSVPLPSSDAKIDDRIVLICAFTEVANSIVYRDSILESLRDSLIGIYKQHITDAQIVSNSTSYASALAKYIIRWSSKDRYGATRKSAIYTPANKKGAWQPTPPKYTDAIEPYWGTLRTFVLDSASQFSTPFDIPFDTAKGSAFYKMCLEEYDSATHIDSVRTMIAKFWDDNPLIILSKGHTMLNYRQISPGGHWINITKIVARQKKLDMKQSADIYMRVSISLADAFIACWNEKYGYELLRPVTYINQYIDPMWKPLIETPPFPEYTCGHSTISAAASYALADYFGDNVEFIDDTNDPYSLPIRKFNSFLAASEEAGRSRMYGGIHFHHSCIVGRNEGLNVGKLIAGKVVTSERH